MSAPSLHLIRPNLTTVEVNGTAYAFSYRTCIGFNRYDGNGWTLRRNEWGPTTGRHLNELDPDHAKRLPAAEFAAALDAL